MRIEYLKEFIILSKNLNFSVTAEQMYITQSVLSRHMSSLEEELGVQLLDRNTKSVSLTELGEFFLSRITKILTEYDALTEELVLRQKNFRHTLRLGVNYYSFYYYLNSIPRYFDRYYPQTFVTYKTGSPDELLSDLMSDNLDAIITTHLPFINADKVSFFDIMEEDLFVLLPKAHPLSNKKELTYDDIKGERFVGVDSNAYAAFWNYISSFMSRDGSVPQFITSYSQPEQASIAVQNGVGIFIEGYLLKHISNDELVTVPLVGEGSNRIISVAYVENIKTPAIAQLIDAFRFVEGYETD